MHFTWIVNKYRFSVHSITVICWEGVIMTSTEYSGSIHSRRGTPICTIELWMNRHAITHHYTVELFNVDVQVTGYHLWWGSYMRILLQQLEHSQGHCSTYIRPTFINCSIINTDLSLGNVLDLFQQLIRNDVMIYLLNNLPSLTLY